MLIVLAVVGLSGCLRVTADNLYSLPQMSEEYLRLQTQINSVLSQGAEFSPPTGGPNRQAVQLKDVNGNGTDEVLAFFTVTGESMLKICIFERIGGDYSIAETIEGIGEAFESVRYADMDGDGVVEIIVGWQMGAALKYMSIYSIRSEQSVLLAREEYSELTVFDLNGDGKKDVVALRLPTQESDAIAQVFTSMSDGEIVRAEARLSSGIDTIARMLAGRLMDGTPAVFVESEGKYDDGNFVTDICAFQNGEFRNISLKEPSGISEDTVRARINSSDINKDGVIEVPIIRLLQTQSDTVYHVIDWYAYGSDGSSRLALTTYHNNNDEWYLVLPFDWRGKVSIRREDIVSGERTVIFSYIDDEEGLYEDFLKVYRLSGEIGEKRAYLPGRVVLKSEGMFTYAFELLAPPNSHGLSFNEALIRENFSLIYSDWLAGAG